MERCLRSRKKVCHEKDRKIVNEDLTNHNSTSDILNDDCLLHIFQYLPISDRIRLERVNKRWSFVSRMSWRTFRTMNFTNRLWGHGTTINRKALQNILNLCGKYLKVLDMSRRSVMLAETIYLKSVLKFSPNLISVDFISIKVGIDLITALVKYCKNISILNLGKISTSVCKLFRDGTIFSTFTNLQVLNIEPINDHCNTGDFNKIFSGNWLQFKNNNSIQELRLEFCRGLVYSNIFTAVPHLPNLHTLCLRGSLEHWISPSDLYCIMQSNIKTLDISSNTSSVNDRFIEKITCLCERLTRLYIGDNSEVTDRGLVALVSSTNLEYLNIDSLNILGHALSSLSFLKTLSCRYCEHLESKYFKNLFKTLDRLESIDLTGAEHVDDIIREAMESVQSRNKDSCMLHMYIDKMIDVDIAGMPDNLKLVRIDQDDDDS